jgi:hypothetical protein
MKIAINDKQPLDEVVRELDRLGYSMAYYSEDEKTCICTYDTYFNCYSTDINQFNGTLTTLTELKNMEV